MKKKRKHKTTARGLLGVFVWKTQEHYVSDPLSVCIGVSIVKKICLILTFKRCIPVQRVWGGQLTITLEHWTWSEKHFFESRIFKVQIQRSSSTHGIDNRSIFFLTDIGCLKRLDSRRKSTTSLHSVIKQSTVLRWRDRPSLITGSPDFSNTGFFWYKICFTYQMPLVDNRLRRRLHPIRTLNEILRK